MAFNHLYKEDRKSIMAARHEIQIWILFCTHVTCTLPALIKIFYGIHIYMYSMPGYIHVQYTWVQYTVHNIYTRPI